MRREKLKCNPSQEDDGGSWEKSAHMVEGQKGQVESIKQQVQDIALNVRDRFKEKVSGKARNALPIPAHQFRG